MTAPEEIALPPDALPPTLRPHVERIVEVLYPTADGATDAFPASAHLTPILNATLTGAASCETADGATFRLPWLVLSGPQPTAYVAQVVGPLRGFYVLFRPTGALAVLGARRFWRGDPPEAPPFHSSVRPALAGAAADFDGALRAAPDAASRASAAVTFLERARAGAPAADLADAAFLDRVIAAVEASDGRVRVAALARALGVSPATLRRRVAVLGLGVKRLTDIVRLRAAHAALHATPGATWPDVVERFGFADQAHFVRSYRYLVGVPPTRWADEARGLDHALGMESTGAPPDSPPREPARDAGEPVSDSFKTTEQRRP